MTRTRRLCSRHAALELLAPVLVHHGGHDHDHPERPGVAAQGGHLGVRRQPGHDGDPVGEADQAAEIRQQEAGPVLEDLKPHLGHVGLGQHLRPRRGRGLRLGQHARLGEQLHQQGVDVPRLVAALDAAAQVAPHVEPLQRLRPGRLGHSAEGQARQVRTLLERRPHPVQRALAHLGQRVRNGREEGVEPDVGGRVLRRQVAPVLQEAHVFARCDQVVLAVDELADLVEIGFGRPAS